MCERRSMRNIKVDISGLLQRVSTLGICGATAKSTSYAESRNDQRLRTPFYASQTKYHTLSLSFLQIWVSPRLRVLVEPCSRTTFSVDVEESSPFASVVSSIIGFSNLKIVSCGKHDMRSRSYSTTRLGLIKIKSFSRSSSRVLLSRRGLVGLSNTASSGIEPSVPSRRILFRAMYLMRGSYVRPK